MSKDNEEAAEGCLKILVAMGLAVPLTLGWCSAVGFVASKVIGWHLVTLGVPRVAWHQAAAVVLLLSVLHAKAGGTKDDREPMEKLSTFVLWLAWPWIALFVGWVLT